MLKLKSLFLSGFKSFRGHSLIRRSSGTIDYGGNRVEFDDVTILIGANGAGKSNVVAFFRMLDALKAEALQEFIGRSGGADTLLHFRTRTTTQLDAELGFEGDGERDWYAMSLASAAPDTLIFVNEAVGHDQRGHAQADVVLGAGHKESRLKECADKGDKTCRLILELLRGCRPYHFHDTSEDARVRKAGYIEDAAYLRSDAGNLAAYLHALRQNHRDYYDRIVRTIAQVFPAFGDFDLRPSELNPAMILLNWHTASHPDHLMGPHQLSDGTLRFMALATLFLQPPDRLPSVIVIDEPELGLHPHAIALLAGMVRSVSARSQVILATESRTLVDQFELSQIRPVELRDGASQFIQLAPQDFAEWLQDYSTGELWEKNVIGGGPTNA